MVAVAAPADRPPMPAAHLHPLAAVHALDISDKHQILTVTLGRLAGDITGGLPFGASIESSVWQAFVDGAAISRIRLTDRTARLA
jgi:hypothetical protein